MRDFVRGFLGRFRKPQPHLPASQSYRGDDDLEQFFTNSDKPLRAFKQQLDRAQPGKHLLVIHGVGGVGKSTLLRMYRLLCQKEHIPAALIGAEEAPTSVVLLARWADDLSTQGVALRTFSGVLKHYFDLRERVESASKQASGEGGILTASAMSAGPLAIRVGNASAESFMDWLRGLLSAPELDLYLDPSIRLTDAFLTDIERTTPGKRIVLMVDTYERMSTLDGWMCSLARRIPENIILVLAGRELPNWNRSWPGWFGRAEVVPLEVMTDANLRDLVQRYHAYIRGGMPDPQQVEAIVQFARGLPIVVTTAVQLWVKYGVADFQTVRPRVVVDLVNSLLEGVPQEMVPVLQIAATVRWFDQPILRALAGSAREYQAHPQDGFVQYDAGLHEFLSRMETNHPRYTEALIYQQRLVENIRQSRLFGDSADRQAQRAEIIHYLDELGLATLAISFSELSQSIAATQKVGLQPPDIDAHYDELLRFPFVQPRTEGLYLHQTVREILDTNLRLQDADRHRELHRRAAAYFESQAADITGEKAERLTLERLYHRVSADEAEGMRLFQELAERLARFRLNHLLRSLLKDVNSYTLQEENSRLWVMYYTGRLAHRETQLDEAEQLYRAVGMNEQAEPKLRAYALCDLGEIWAKMEYLSQPNGVEQALDALEQSRRLTPRIDSKLIRNLSHRSHIHNFKCEWQESIALLEQQRQWYERENDRYGVVSTSSWLKGTQALVGNWNEALMMRERILQEVAQLPDNLFLRARLFLDSTSWALVWVGRYHEAEREGLEAQALAQRLNLNDLLALSLRDLAYAAGMQRKYQQADAYFNEAFDTYQILGKAFEGGIGNTLGFLGAVSIKRGDLTSAEDYLKRSLEIKRTFQDKMGTPEILAWLGELYEIRGDWSTAQNYYLEYLRDYHRIGRQNFECSIRTNLIRVKYAQGDYPAIPALLEHAERLARLYGYNDQLAMLCLTRGHLAWEDQSASGDKAGTALRYYQQALVYALHFNRFLLDEVLAGDAGTTPLRPIIPHCLKHGPEGRQLLNLLREWWQTSHNTAEAPGAETNSPARMPVSLPDAERDARQREPGDGSASPGLVEQIDAALMALDSG